VAVWTFSSGRLCLVWWPSGFHQRSSGGRLVFFEPSGGPLSAVLARLLPPLLPASTLCKIQSCWSLVPLT